MHVVTNAHMATLHSFLWLVFHCMYTHNIHIMCIYIYMCVCVYIYTNPTHEGPTFLTELSSRRPIPSLWRLGSQYTGSEGTHSSQNMRQKEEIGRSSVEISGHISSE